MGQDIVLITNMDLDWWPTAAVIKAKSFVSLTSIFISLLLCHPILTFFPGEILTNTSNVLLQVSICEQVSGFVKIYFLGYS